MDAVYDYDDAYNPWDNPPEPDFFFNPDDEAFLDTIMPAFSSGHESMNTFTNMIHDIVYPARGSTNNFLTDAGEYDSELYISRSEKSIDVDLNMKIEDALQFLKSSQLLQKLQLLYPNLRLTLIELREIGRKVHIEVDCTASNSNNITVVNFYKHVTKVLLAKDYVANEDELNFRSIQCDFVFPTEDNSVQLYTALTFIAQTFVASILLLFRKRDPCPILESSCFITTFCKIDKNGSPQYIEFTRLLQYMSDASEHAIDEVNVMDILQHVATKNADASSGLLKQIIVSPDPADRFPYWRTIRDFRPLTNPPRLSPTAALPAPEMARTVDPSLLRAYREKQAMAFRGIVPTSDLEPLRRELAAQEMAAGIASRSSAIRDNTGKPSLGGKRGVSPKKRRGTLRKRSVTPARKNTKKRSRTPKGGRPPSIKRRTLRHP
jgi:hypothetical protein